MSVNFHPKTAMPPVARLLRRNGYLLLPDGNGGCIIIEAAQAQDFPTLGDVWHDAERLRALAQPQPCCSDEHHGNQAAIRTPSRRGQAPWRGQYPTPPAS